MMSLSSGRDVIKMMPLGDRFSPTPCKIILLEVHYPFMHGGIFVPSPVGDGLVTHPPINLELPSIALLRAGTTQHEVLLSLLSSSPAMV